MHKNNLESSIIFYIVCDKKVLHYLDECDKMIKLDVR